MHLSRRTAAIRISTPFLWIAAAGFRYISGTFPIVQKVKGLIIRYPAVISGIFIYSYYFFTSIEWYRRWKMDQVETFGFVSQFDALLWMWLLSYVFVKVLHLRGRLHAEEEKQLIQKCELERKEIQLRTLREVNFTLKDLINNPLAIIMAYLRRIRLRRSHDEETISDIETVHQAAEHIRHVTERIDNVNEYRLVEKPYGNLVEIL